MSLAAQHLSGWIAVFFALVHVTAASESATYSPWLTADFTFNWTPSGVNVSVPTTGTFKNVTNMSYLLNGGLAQCDPINITWTPLNNGSPDPVPPYYLHVYTSTMQQPLIVPAGTFSPFQWPVPFEPDTQYQICMFDSKGQTGGCQDAYTVIPARNSTRTCNTTLTNTNALVVEGVTENGPLTQYGWPDQCTTISMTPQNGTPPFTMTVAPSLHPPFNLTFNDMDPMNWTITLGWGMRFWVSIFDATGASWAYGPMHSGGNGPTDCLHRAGSSLVTQPSTSSSPRHISVSAAVGIAIGCAVFGIIFTLVIQYFLSRNRSHKDEPEGETEAKAGVTSLPGTPGIDPYPLGTFRSQPTGPTEPESTVTSQRNESQVYVVHHDAGGAPITIFTGGREVQELPPHYPSRGSPEPRPSHTPSTSLDSAAGISRPAGKPGPPMRSLSEG